ncbi:MAG TPA: hypothetical protein PKK56_03130, partial [archaeon]|nr:hypothetical protein [archaeon]
KKKEMEWKAGHPVSKKIIKDAVISDFAKYDYLDVIGDYAPYYNTNVAEKNNAISVIDTIFIRPSKFLVFFATDKKEVAEKFVHEYNRIVSNVLDEPDETLKTLFNYVSETEFEKLKRKYIK